MPIDSRVRAVATNGRRSYFRDARVLSTEHTPLHVREVVAPLPGGGAVVISRVIDYIDHDLGRLRLILVLVSLGAVAAASRQLLCQTEELRSFLEGNVPQACGKCLLMPPIVPAPAPGPPRPGRAAAGGRGRPPRGRARPAGAARVGPVWTTWRAAPQDALYGREGFYARGERPAAHFRTSVHVSPRYAQAILALLRHADAALGHPDRRRRPRPLVDDPLRWQRYVRHDQRAGDAGQPGEVAADGRRVGAEPDRRRLDADQLQRLVRPARPQRGVAVVAAQAILSVVLSGNTWVITGPPQIRTFDVQTTSDAFANIPGFIGDVLWNIYQFVAHNYAFLLTVAGVMALIAGFVLVLVPF